MGVDFIWILCNLIDILLKEKARLVGGPDAKVYVLKNPIKFFG